MPNFIGIDLAWQSDKNNSGGAALRGDHSGVTLCDLSSGLATLAAVESFISRNTDTDTVVAIDAPLVIKNLDRQRPCETEIGRRFGAADASAHTTNLKRFPDASSVKLASDLEADGFVHYPELHTRRLAGKWFFEVYPHPAHVVLFKRGKIVKYKRGTVTTRRRGLCEFRDGFKEYLYPAEPRLIENDELRAFLGKSLEELRGDALKNYEDILDAIFCAYLAAYVWAWGFERNEMIGDREFGYILNPKAQIA
jgi:predicted RNase H-like nuclease